MLEIKIKMTSESRESFLDELNLKLKDRYTENDERYMENLSKESHPPVIVIKCKNVNSSSRGRAPYNQHNHRRNNQFRSNNYYQNNNNNNNNRRYRSYDRNYNNQNNNNNNNNRVNDNN